MPKKQDPIERITRAIIRHPQNKTMKSRGYHPVFSASTTARIVLIGQAPGIKAQTSGVPWDDQSGKQLREWMGVSDEVFYDKIKIALISMDFYFPGKGKTGDLPPRKGFAELWHPQLFSVMPKADLVVLIGQYAQAHYLEKKAPTLTETVRNYKQYLKDGYFPLPHPSPRNNIWKKKNPWFEKTVVPDLKRHVHQLL